MDGQGVRDPAWKGCATGTWLWPLPTSCCDGSDGTICPVCEQITLKTKSRDKRGLTATLLRRHSWHAPSFRIRAALSRCTHDNGPVRRRLGRRIGATSLPSLTENTPWVAKLGEFGSALYAVAADSVEISVASDDATVALVDVEDEVSFLMGTGLAFRSGSGPWLPWVPFGAWPAWWFGAGTGVWDRCVWWFGVASAAGGCCCPA